MAWHKDIMESKQEKVVGVGGQIFGGLLYAFWVLCAFACFFLMVGFFNLGQWLAGIVTMAGIVLLLMRRVTLKKKKTDIPAWMKLVALIGIIAMAAIVSQATTKEAAKQKLADQMAAIPQKARFELKVADEQGQLVSTGLDSRDIEDVTITYSEATAEKTLLVKFNEQGAALLTAVTAANLNKLLTPFMDGKALSSMMASEPVTDGEIVIRVDGDVEAYRIMLLNGRGQ
jgi:hypothetical protein